MSAIIPAALMAILPALSAGDGLAANSAPPVAPAPDTAPAIVLAQAEFLAGIEDLPLMPGLTEEPNSAVVFDTDSGRLVTVQAFGNVSADAMRWFYREALINLGWTPLSDSLADSFADPGNPDGTMEFSRQGEQLTITRQAYASGLLLVRFSLSPLTP